MNRMKLHYQEKVLPELKKELKRHNDLAVPKVEKVVINVGISEDQHQDKALANMAEQLGQIAGQKAKITAAKKSISGFKLRAGDPIGVAVTLRGERMYQFMDKLVSIVLPRVKDFQGIKSTAFDGQGNYSLGLEEQIVFPEIDYDKIDKVRGMQINIVTTAKNPKEGKRLMELLGFPFEKEELS